jgi:hypothetical protein
MQYESADTADSYSPDKRRDARAAAHSAPSHNTRATSAFAAPYSAPTTVVPGEQPHSLSAVGHEIVVFLLSCQLGERTIRRTEPVHRGSLPRCISAAVTCEFVHGEPENKQVCRLSGLSRLQLQLQKIRKNMKMFDTHPSFHV